MLALLFLSACTRPLSCGKDTKVDFESPAPEARPFTIAIKSYRGSRQAIVEAAIVMMNQNPRFTAGATGFMTQTASQTVVLAADEDDPACIALAVTYKSTASIAELTQLMRAIEERLTPVPNVDPKHPAVKLELWWVGGTSGSGYGWQLPHPLILEEPWANDLFVTGSEPIFAGFVERHPSERPWAVRVASMSQRNRDKPVPRRTGWALEMPRAEQTEQGLLYRQGGADEADMLALGTTLTFVIDVQRHRVTREPEFRAMSWDRQFQHAQAPFEKRALSWVEAVEVRVPAQATAIERYQLWVQGVRKAVDMRSLGVGTVVIFDDQPELIRGAVIGEPVPREQMVPAARAEQRAAMAPNPDQVLPSRIEITTSLPAPEARDAGT
jgi:hypothetical protein